MSLEELKEICMKESAEFRIRWFSGLREWSVEIWKHDEFNYYLSGFDHESLESVIERCVAKASGLTKREPDDDDSASSQALSTPENLSDLEGLS